MSQPVSFLDLKTPHHELERELVQAFRGALQSATFIGGPEVENFEREFAAYCGTAHAVAVASGTDALRFALIASGVGRGDAVVTVAHTFIATVEAISQAGAEAEFTDIDDRTYNMSVTALAEYLASCDTDAATGRPLGRRSRRPIKAILPVHLYGQIADMGGITRLAEKYGLLVIEDACQAHGAYYQTEGVQRRAGSLGKAAAFSFYPGKNLGACGEGGAVTTDDPAVARAVSVLRDHGQFKKYYHELEGYNGRLDSIQAAFLRIKLRHLDAWNFSRRAVASRYNVMLADLEVVTPSEPAWSTAVYHLYVIRTRDRDALREHLQAQGISTGLHYPVPVHLQSCYRHWGYTKGTLPATEMAASQILSLPMFPGLTIEEQARVCAAIQNVTREASL